MNPTPETTPSRRIGGSGSPVDRQRLLHRLTVVALTVLFLILCLTIPALRWHNTREALSRLAAAEAEADRLDPGWRMEDLLAARAAVPDAENAALVLLEVVKLKPANWPPERFHPNGTGWLIDSEIAMQRQTHRAPDELLDLLRGDLYVASAALDAAVPLQRMHTGRFTWVNGEQSLDHLQSARAVANLVLLDAMYRAHTGDMAGAARCCRAGLALPRAFGDEPSALSSLVRVGIAWLAIAHLERVLALGEFSSSELQELQRLIQREEGTPVMLLVLRGTRAWDHRMLAGEKALRYLGSTLEDAEGEELTQLAWTRRLFLSDQAWRAGSSARGLEISAPAIEAARLPPHEQLQRFVELGEALKVEQKGAIARLHNLYSRGSGQQVISLACLRSSARLRCADAALAVERYRLKHGKWPPGLDDLVPEFLPAVSLDPFTGQRLTFQRTEHGVIVYSFGADKRDDAGDVEDDITLGRRATDEGFRLYEPWMRGRLPLPPLLEGLLQTGEK